ncbi:hypothetical protein Pelo_19084 [Pelomyxa schiedti]|nr:hypothetical protein Pelo_19084 [Pelomyxa schiedti]
MGNASSKPTSAAAPPPPRPTNRPITLDAVIQAADQFVAFACGSIVSRTRVQSPARLLAASPSLVGQFGREWVLRGCRDVVLTVNVNYMPEVSKYDQAHVWMCVSPTLGVVRSAQFGTSDTTEHQLIGHIGWDCESSTTATPAAELRAHNNKELLGAGRSDRSGGDRLVAVKGFVPQGVSIDVVDGSGSVVENLREARFSLEDHRYCCTSKWLVLIVKVEMTLWKLSDGPQRTSVKINLEGHVHDLVPHESDPDLLIMPFSNSTGLFLWHIDLKKSFAQREIVPRRDPTPLPFTYYQYIRVLGCDPNICAVSIEEGRTVYQVYNTTTKCTHALTRCPLPIRGHLFTPQMVTTDETDEIFHVFHTSNPSTPFISVPCKREIPDTLTIISDKVSFVTGGVVVWECMRVQMPEGYLQPWPARYAITDAETDTLLAFLDNS